jgi:hypothetical protein
MERGRVFTIAALLLALPVAARALDRLTVHSGLLHITNGEEDGAPSALVPPLGAWTPVPLRWLPGLSWEAGVMMMGLTYTWDSESERGVPVEVEHANTFWVLGLAGDLRAVYQWRLRDNLELGITGGLLVLMRVPVIPYDDAASDWGSLATFFAMRSVFPEVGGGLRWQALGTTAVVVQLRALYPLHNLWDADTPSALDHFTAGLIVGLDFDL